uniref:Uncharacterized protein n=1 Tax=Rhizophora mucronata TaxID=61149 RepID=A0A2P2PT91_RHIMU
MAWFIPLGTEKKGTVQCLHLNLHRFSQLNFLLFDSNSTKKIIVLMF